jgi:tRNA pseudouridine13 synthase
VSAASAPRIRACPEDFRVDEIALYEPTGEGGHTFIHLEKTLRTTEEVARDLARAAAVRPGDVGYAGRKDRVAVTRQWFSVPELDPEVARGLDLPGVTVLGASRHPHKLRTGQLAGNRFDLWVRDVDDAQHADLESRLEVAATRGLPNRFGGQRFGRDGDNVERARALLSGERIRGGKRAVRFLLSALQSEVFNVVLEQRPLPIDAIELGDIAMRHESGGSFLVEDVLLETPRVASFEISPTGPIFGNKVRQPEGAPAERERAVLEAHDIDPDALPRVPGIRLRGSRRALRIRPGEPSLEREGSSTRLCFTLPPGSYATVVLEELLGRVPTEGQ